MIFDPFSLAMSLMIIGCSVHAFGNTCDEDAKCLQFGNMPACYERTQGDIHTRAYLRALRYGHNPKKRLVKPVIYVRP